LSRRRHCRAGGGRAKGKRAGGHRSDSIAQESKSSGFLKDRWAKKERAIKAPSSWGRTSCRSGGGPRGSSLGKKGKSATHRERKTQWFAERRGNRVSVEEGQRVFEISTLGGGPLGKSEPDPGKINQSTGKGLSPNPPKGGAGDSYVLRGGVGLPSHHMREKGKSESCRATT